MPTSKTKARGRQNRAVQVLRTGALILLFEKKRNISVCTLLQTSRSRFFPCFLHVHQLYDATASPYSPLRSLGSWIIIIIIIIIIIKIEIIIIIITILVLKLSLDEVLTPVWFITLDTNPARRYRRNYNFYLPGYDNQIISGTPEECSRFCSSASFICRSFDYRKSTNQCSLSNRSTADAQIDESNSYDHYEISKYSHIHQNP